MTNQGSLMATDRSIDWTELLTPDEQLVFGQVLRAAREREIPFALGGAVARTVYTGQWRNTKDLDIYVTLENRERLIEVLDDCGFVDFHDQLPYDREWLYRGTAQGALVDVIWAMANLRTDVDEEWISSGPEISFLGERVRVIPAEELIWAKLYVIQRQRCDWPDVLNILDHQLESLDWHRLLRRLGDDAPLLAGALAVYSWLRPGRRGLIPVRARRAGTSGDGDPDLVHERRKLIDSRPWFGSEIEIPRT
jgi:hypothetical protein